MGKFIFVTILLAVSNFIVPAFGFDHTAWDNMLKQNVVLQNSGRASRVNYKNFKVEEKKLDSYLETLSAVKKNDFDSWPEAERLAFLINAYNAFTIKLILSKYPDLKSIKDLGGVFSSPWKKKFFKLFTEDFYLDRIEQDIIRKEYKEPRIHFAVNCASIGCPMLLNEAYVAKRLEDQLERGLKNFLSDSTRNTYDKGSKSLQISKIFDWYGEDFKKGYLGYSSVSDVMAKYADLLTADTSAQSEIKSKTSKIKYLNYDWNLNSL